MEWNVFHWVWSNLLEQFFKIVATLGPAHAS